jgi:TonB-dependent SusC/RagA subfamily outer membrane receptor
MKYIFRIIIVLIALQVSSSYAQGKKSKKKQLFTGLVIDQQKNPIKNASVFIDGRKARVMSDEEGLFHLKLRPDVKTITVFTLYNGVAEANYKGEKNMSFVLKTSGHITQDPLNKPKEEESDLVNVGYGKAKKRNISSSVGEVRDDRIKNERHYTTIFDMIKGEVPGVIVSGTSITIRGKSSLMLSNEPLFVVNGSPTSNIADISPVDVKSISVLKGASASIYGSRGANGVIVIELRSGNDK